jgi:ankyrin repeat domain-containing protein 50
MHQTVREFFLHPDGDVPPSEFGMCEKDSHICISIICIRYLMLCATNTNRLLPDVKSWTSEHFEDYAQSLHQRPLANYALCHLKYHIDGSKEDENIRYITSQFIDKLAHNPAIYLLENWVGSELNKLLVDKEQGTAAKDFRNKVICAAARKGFSTVAEMLLAVGADVNARDQGNTPLLWAAWSGHEAVVSLLADRPDVDVNSRASDGRTPLSKAAEMGHKMVVKLLLDTGRVDPDSKSQGLTPLSYAVGGEHEGIVKLLLDTKRVDPDSKEPVYGITPLYIAAGRGLDRVVKLLLDTNGVDPDSRDHVYGQTPLSIAACCGDDAVVKLLEPHSSLSQ